MEFTEEAKSTIEARIGDVMGRMSLSGRERAEVEKELRSSYYERAEARAKEKGASKVTVVDAGMAIADEGAPEQIAACYMRSYSGSLRRAGLLSRTVAYLLDMVGVSVCIGILVIPMILLMVGAQNVEETSWIVALLIVVNLGIALAILGVILCYFVILEGYFGMTPGKWLLGLKVLREDGTRIGYREALLRNIPKFFEGLITIDALIMLIFFNREKQRGFDKVAGTIVVHARG